MPSRSLAIVEDMLLLEGTQLERGALRALAARESAESLARLANIATSETEAGRRQRAEDEVLMLEGAALNTVAAALREKFGFRDAGRNAYGILGRLANQGKQCRLQKASWTVRLWLAGSLRSYFYGVWSWELRLRALRAGIVGGLLGCLLLAVFYALFYGVRLHERGFYVGSVLLVALVSSFVGVLATQRAVPIGYQCDRLAALVVEVAGAMVCCFAGLVASLWLVVLVYGLSAGFKEAWETIHTWNAFARFFWVSVLAGIVRAATVGGYGLFNTQRRNRYSQIACGVMSTWLAIIGFAYILWKMMPTDTLDYAVTGGTLRHFVLWMSNFNMENKFWDSGGWFLLTVGCSFAAAFVAVDAEAVRVQPTRGHGMNGVWLAVVLVCVALMVPIVGIGGNERLSRLDGVAEKIVFSGDGSLIATVSLDEESKGDREKLPPQVMIRIWNVGARQLSWELRDKSRKPVTEIATAVSFSPDGRLVAIRGDNEIRLLETSTARQIASIQVPSEHDSSAGVVFSPNGEQLIVPTVDPREVQVWDVTTRSLHHRLKEEGRGIYTKRLVLSGDGSVLAVSDAYEIRVWDLVKGESRVINDSARFDFIALSPDGRLLAASERFEGSVKLWDIKNFREIYSGKTRNGGPVAIAPNGKVWVSVSDGKVRVRDVATGRDISILYTRTEDISSVAFSPDGRMLAVADTGDKVVKLWDERDLRIFGGSGKAP